MLALINYGSGNVRSVYNALRHEGAEVELVASPEELARASAIILPGVGAFGDCVRGLQQRNFWDPLRTWLESGRPFLGICVGYQLLFEESEESPGVRGFGYFEGRVRRFATPGLKIPQIGWNRLELVDRSAPLWRGLPGSPHVYFVHSFFPEPVDESIITARAHYGEYFAAAVGRDNVVAVQFHPEKSQAIGLGILRNFVVGTATERVLSAPEAR
jgi:glutamine amidotransferase